MSYILRHFTERELACKHCGHSGCQDELKQALDQYRDVVCVPVYVHDAFRCIPHNDKVSLVSRSQHPLGTAADIEVPGFTLQQMYDAALKVEAFKYGGIGVYQTSAGKVFIHVDTRRAIARWAFVGNKQMPAHTLVQG